MEEAATTAEKLQRGSFLLERLKPKSTEYKDKWAVDVYRNSPAARRKKFLSLLEQGSVFKDDDVHRVQTLEEINVKTGTAFP